MARSRALCDFSHAVLLLFSFLLVTRQQAVAFELAARNLPAVSLPTLPASKLQLESSPTTTPAVLHANHPVLDLRNIATVESVDGYTYLGCYTDSNNRVLSTRIDDNSMAPDLCRLICAQRNRPVFGVENGRECYCDTSLAASAVIASSADCSKACAGDLAALCGGWFRINVYSATAIATGGAGSPAVTTTGLVSGLPSPSHSSLPSSGSSHVGFSAATISGIAIGAATFAVLACSVIF